MDQTPAAAPAAPQDLVAVDNIDQFAHLVTQWHEAKIAMLAHMKSIPDGTMMQFGEGQPEEALTGDLLKGFQLGLSFALNEMGDLPFTPEFEEAPAPAVPS